MRHSLIPANLRYVDQVARSGSIQRAARELHVAASAINRQILQLEESLGVPLFERLPRGMRPTVSGDAIVTLARRWRQDEHRLVAEIRRYQGIQQGHVSVVAMDSHATGFLPAFVEALATSHPLISLSIEIASTDEAESALISGKADLAIVFNLPPRRELLTLWKCELPLGCVVAPGHPIATRSSIRLQEAASYPLALQSRSLAIRRLLEGQYSWLFTGQRLPVQSNSLQLVKQLAKDGQYVVLTSELDAAPELVAGTLRFIPIRDQGAEPQTVSTVISATRPPGAVVKLVADRLAQAAQTGLDHARAAIRRPAGNLDSRPAIAPAESSPVSVAALPALR